MLLLLLLTMMMMMTLLMETTYSWLLPLSVLLIAPIDCPNRGRESFNYESRFFERRTTQ